MSQTYTAIQFIQDLEQPGAPIIPKIKAHKKPQAAKRTSQKKTEMKVKRAIQKPLKRAIETKTKNKIVLTFSSTMTHDAVKDFLDAVNALSPQKMSTLPRVAKENIKLLRTSRNENIKKQYKRIMTVVPHVGSINYKRGKGSHCIIDIPLQ